MTIYNLNIFLSLIRNPFPNTMSGSNCCFLTCIQIFQETGQVVWYSHLFKNFPRFVVIHIVKGFGIVNKAEIDVFLELSCFFDDPAEVGNLISGSSAFSKSSLNIWKFMVNMLLKPALENFEHYFTSVWDECNCVVVSAFFGIAFLWDWNENWPFQSCGHCCVFQIWPWSTEWSRSKANRVLPRERTGHSKHPLPTTQEKTLHMDITRWLITKSDWLYFLQPKMEKLYTVGKNRSGVDCGSDHEFLIAKFRLKLKKVGKTTRTFRYDLNQIPYDYIVEVRNRFKGLDLIDCLMNYGWKFVTLYRRQGSRPSPRKRNAKKQNGCLRRPYK